MAVSISPWNRIQSHWIARFLLICDVLLRVHEEDANCDKQDARLEREGHVYVLASTWIDVNIVRRLCAATNDACGAVCFICAGGTCTLIWSLRYSFDEVAIQTHEKAPNAADGPHFSLFTNCTTLKLYDLHKKCLNSSLCNYQFKQLILFSSKFLLVLWLGFYVSQLINYCEV